MIAVMLLLVILTYLIGFPAAALIAVTWWAGRVIFLLVRWNARS